MRTLGLVLLAMLLAAQEAAAGVVVRPPPREAFCTDRVLLGVRHVAPGPRLFSISVYSPSGRRVFHRSGVARSTARHHAWRPIDDRHIRYGFSVYRTVYRIAGSRPRTFRTRVLCGE